MNICSNIVRRNNVDDVAVLRRELHNVQKLMSSNFQDETMQSAQSGIFVINVSPRRPFN